MRKFSILGAAAVALILVAVSVPANAASRKPQGVTIGQAVQTDLSARRRHHRRYVYRYYRPRYRYYYGRPYAYPYYFYRPRYYRYYYPYRFYYYRRPGFYFGFSF
jgi:hypothetical protein